MSRRTFLALSDADRRDLVAWLRRRGLSQDQIARRLEVSRSLIFRLCRPRPAPVAVEVVPPPACGKPADGIRFPSREPSLGPSCSACGGPHRAKLRRRRPDLCDACLESWLVAPSDAVCVECGHPLSNDRLTRNRTRTLHTCSATCETQHHRRRIAEGRALRQSAEHHGRDGWLPTEDEIAAATAEIRASWSEAERERRCVVKPEPVRYLPQPCPQPCPHV